jgi:hypothetical protein
VSYLWSFATFDADRLLSLFGDPAGAATARLVELSGLEATGFDDADRAADVARRFAGSGLSYEGLDAGDARVADKLLMLIFSPEGFARELGVEDLSDQGVHPLEINELLARAPDARLLPALILGRRAGQDEASRCEYCVLAPDELAALVREIDRGLADERPWPTAAGRATLQRDLRAPLERALEQGRWVYGRLSQG